MLRCPNTVRCRSCVGNLRRLSWNSSFLACTRIRISIHHWSCYFGLPINVAMEDALRTIVQVAFQSRIDRLQGESGCCVPSSPECSSRDICSSAMCYATPRGTRGTMLIDGEILTARGPSSSCKSSVCLASPNCISGERC